MNRRLFFCALWLNFLLGATHAFAEVVIKQRNIEISAALDAIAKDMQLNLDSALDPKTAKLKLSQTMSGRGSEILRRLASVYNFDWYIYGSSLNVESGHKIVQFTLKPKNMPADVLRKELNKVFVRSKTIKIQLVDRGQSLHFSGSSKFLNNAVNYARMVDRNYFLEHDTNLEVATINFLYKSVNDRTIRSFNEEVVFPGALTLVSSFIANMGQFENIADEAAVENVEKALSVKLTEGDPQDQLMANDTTNKVQILPGSNALLIRGTPEEIELAKQIAKMIDVKRHQILFTLKVYDVATDSTRITGLDSSWLDGSRGVYDIIMPTFTNTSEFVSNLNALYENKLANSVYETNLIVMENQEGRFGKRDTATMALVSDQQVDVREISADNSLYITGRLLPSGEVHATVEYIEQALSQDSAATTAAAPRVSSQNISSEVNIKPEQTIILGGFENVTSERYEKGVPVLSKIPLIGVAFKNDMVVKRKFKRYISVSFEVVE